MYQPEKREKKRMSGIRERQTSKGTRREAMARVVAGGKRYMRHLRGTERAMRRGL